MKEIKSVSDDPEFVRCNDAVLKCQTELLKVGDRAAQVELEILNIKTAQPKDDGEWNQFIAGAVSDATSDRTQLDALREEQGNLQQQHEFLGRSLEQGKAALDKIRGRVSLELCKSYRPEFAKDAKEIMHHLKAICDLTQRSLERRYSLERSGIVTGSIPSTVIDIGGTWDDRCGGKVVGYQKWVKENYPEIF